MCACPKISAALLYKSLCAMSVLHVAEKNSIAKQVANILSRSSKRTGISLSKYNPNFEFELDSVPMKFTSVCGHIFDYELPAEYKNWYGYDNKQILLQVPMIKVLGSNSENIVKNLEKLAKEHKELVLWLDCDREGEAIAFEVIEVCSKVNPKMRIRRARFAAVTPTDVWNAYNNLVAPNSLEADAVNYRIEIDFRMGCAFTRYQTTLFQTKYQLTEASVLSYGPCQMPTLSFVVDRYLEIANFKPEKYWLLDAICVINEKTGIPFTWSKKNTRSEVEANTILHQILSQFPDGNVMGHVKSRNQKDKKKYRPYPLTTVQLQKLVTDKLRMSSAKAMEVAERLYQKGLISYPRTETNAFPQTMNLKSLVGQLSSSSTYGNYVDLLVNQNQFMNPKVGKSNDQAHTPIHPVKNIELKELESDEKKVYDLICRHFLACCSKDAIGSEFQVKADIGGQEFKASYLSIIEKNYLEIYPYEKWVETSFPSDIPEDFPVLLTLKDGKTTPPGYLTESDLIGLMEKNQIGTDSTIHEHIQTIQTRKYAIKTGNTFKPTDLGASLVQTYRKLEIELPECEIRRKIEQSMNRIAEGEIPKAVATKNTLESMVPTYDKLQLLKEQWIKNLKEFMESNSQLHKISMQLRDQGACLEPKKAIVEAFPCPKCGQPTIVRSSSKNNSYFLGCSKYPHCKWTQSLPNYIDQVESTDQLCPKCGNGSKLVTLSVKDALKVHPLIMRIRFHEGQNHVKLCLTPGCEQSFYEDMEQSDFQRNSPQPSFQTHQDDSNQNQSNQFSRNAATYTQNSSATLTPQNQSFRQEKKSIVCYFCKQVGHIAPQCPKKDATSPKKRNEPHPSSNFGNSKIQCFKCGKIGHIAPQCPQKGAKQPTNMKSSTKTLKICPECGVEGRHPRMSNCSLVKRKNPQNKSSNSVNDSVKFKD